MTPPRSIVQRARGRGALVGLAALTIVPSACGGSDDAESADAQVSSSAAVDVSGSEPAVEDSQAAPGEAAQGAVDGEELTPFCRESAEFYVTVSALDYLNVQDDAGARQIYNAVPAQIDDAIAAAESPEEASEPQRMKATLTVVTEALEQVGWDVDELPNLPNAPEIGNAITEVGETTSRLATYLDATCGLDLSRLGESAVSVAESVATQPLVFPDGQQEQPAQPEEPADANPPTADPTPLETKPGGADPSSAPFAVGEVRDDSGLLRTRVPASWVQVRGTPDGAVRQLSAAPDLEAFLSGFSVPGVSIVSGSVDDGQLAADNGLRALVSSLGNAGCAVGESAPYADAFYAGTQVTAVCNTEGTPTYLISGSNAANDVFFLVILAEGADFAGVYDVVTSSFRVD